MSTGFDQIAAYAPLELRDRKMLERYNIERVRGYLEKNLGCSNKEVIRALHLHPRTVAKAIRIIRSEGRKN
jgi:hypothetical protein